MSISYRVYGDDGDGTGGPINYATPVATVSALTFTTGPLAFPGVYSFLVRAFDTVTGLEDQNGDARVTVRLDATGKDISLLPNAPAGLTATPLAAGGAKVSWIYGPAGQGSKPTGFHVYVGIGTPNYATPAATVAFHGGAPSTPYFAKLTGLTGGTTYAVGVRTYNASGEETNVSTASITAVTAGPSPVVSLTSTVTP